jgi:uncharacterized integral membrane protein (TIGR00698 family)
MSALATNPAASPRPLRTAPGLVLCAALAALAIGLGSLPWMQAHGLSALTLAIALGLAAGNTFYGRLAPAAGPGVATAKQTLLRLGVVLYGLRLTLQDLQHLGFAGIAVDALVLSSTFALAWFIGTRVLGLDRRTTILIGAGSSICGAAAVMATEPVVRARSDEVAVAVATVVAFGTVSIFLYPALFSLNAIWHFLPTDAASFGTYIGSTVHEVAQVVAASRTIGPEAADAAVVAKMARVMMLAPFLLALSAWLPGERSGGEPHAAPTQGRRGPRIQVPGFAIAFIGVVLFNSLHVLPAAWVDAMNQIDTFLLAMAMAGLGLSTQVRALRKAGVRPMLLALTLFVWLVGGGAWINRVIEGAWG